MLFSTVSPDSTSQTDTEKQDLLDFKKDKLEPCDKNKAPVTVSKGTKGTVNAEFEFSKPKTEAFSVYRERTREARSANNSPCKPKLSVDHCKNARLNTCKSVKRSRDYDSPVSSLEEVILLQVFLWRVLNE